MNEVKVFEFDQYDIRTFVVDDDVFFVANDVAKVLGYSNPSKATNDHCKKPTTRWGNDSLGRQQEFKVIPESDVYRLIFRSKLPSAERFESWVVEDVLPTIRKAGHYTVPKTFAEALRVAADQQALLELQKPKVDFFDQVASSKDAIEMGDVAKVLNIPGIGRNKLFEILRSKKILQNNNVPYQKYCDAGYFRVIEQKYGKPDGSVNINIKTLVYQKGLAYIRKSLEKE